MKKITTALLTWCAALTAAAQVYVWKDGQVIWSMTSGTPDSLTLTDPYAAFRFSVSDSASARFAPGNLQYNDYYGEWSFASSQYEVIGSMNTRIAPYYDGLIDLFGWGTCGWSIGFEPSSTSTEYTDYLVGGSWDNSLTGTYAMADWGVSNAVGGYAEGVWRTPSSDEWNYLFAGRDGAASLFALATVCGVKGLILLPDNWRLPDGLTFTPSVNSHLTYTNGLYEDSSFTNDGYADNSYDATQWNRMETAGAVFLPAAGRRWGTELRNYPNNPWGIYWSSTTGSEERGGNVRALSFYMSGVTPLAETCRAYGCSVRLIRLD